MEYMEHKAKDSPAAIASRTVSMIHRRQPFVRTVLFTLIEFLLLGKIKWSTIRFVWDLDMSLSHTTALALRMPEKRNKVNSRIGKNNSIQSICDCGSVVVDVQIDCTEYAINCHCTGCRRYHTGPFTSFLKTDLSEISIRRGKEKIGKYFSECKELGPVERWFCMDCSSKIISAPQSISSYSTNDSGGGKRGNDYDNNYNATIKGQTSEFCTSNGKPNQATTCFVNLGPVVDNDISPTITSVWKDQLEQENNNLHFEKRNGIWVDAQPEHSLDFDNVSGVFDFPQTWSGGCSCGACRYDFILEYPTELQHCYCNLCRKLSGGPFMSWIPVEKEFFRWRPSTSLQLVRTTSFGRRHICKNCKSVMTIVYDEQPDLVWPCAGSLGDSSLPKDVIEMGKYFSRVCHICCRYHPTWLEIRDDGLDRIEEAC